MEKTALPSGNRQVDAAHFQATVCKMLLLPPDTDARQLRRVLESRGNDFVEWYDNRLSAIEEYSLGVATVRETITRRTTSGRPTCQIK
jgi:hypothetical protein